MNYAVEKREEFREERKQAQWDGWRKRFKGMSDFAIVDLLVERHGLSEWTRYSLYRESRKYRVKVLRVSLNQSDNPALPL